MKKTIPEDMQMMADAILKLRFYAEKNDEIYKKFLSECKNSNEQKKLSLTYDKYLLGFSKIHANSINLYKTHESLRELTFKQGTDIEKLTKKLEKQDDKASLKTLNELSQNGLKLAAPLLQNQINSFFKFIFPCTEFLFSVTNPTRFIKSLMECEALCNTQLKKLEDEQVLFKAYYDNYATYTLTLQTFIDKFDKKA